MDRRRLIYYLLLNVFISACVTGSILYFYDRAYRADCAQLAAIPTLPIMYSTTPVTDGIQVDIVSVVGAGVISSEVVVIKNNGNDPVILTGWFLKDNEDNIYTFPQLSLFKDGTVQVHTISGTDTAVDLYWDRSSPVWQSGELASLYDSQGVLRALYHIP